MTFIESDGSPSLVVYTENRPPLYRHNPAVVPNQMSPRRSCRIARTTFEGRPSGIMKDTTRPFLNRLAPPPRLPIHRPPSRSVASAVTSSLATPYRSPHRRNTPSRYMVSPGHVPIQIVPSAPVQIG